MPGKDPQIFDSHGEFCPPCRAIPPLVKKLHEARADVRGRRGPINRPGVEGIDWKSPVAKEFQARFDPALPRSTAPMASCNSPKAIRRARSSSIGCRPLRCNESPAAGPALPLRRGRVARGDRGRPREHGGRAGAARSQVGEAPRGFRPDRPRAATWTSCSSATRSPITGAAAGQGGLGEVLSAACARPILASAATAPSMRPLADGPRRTGRHPSEGWSSS